MKRHESKDEYNERKQRARKIILHLEKLFPHADMMLLYRTHFELLVAVMLSAQCTDKKVNEVTPSLFAHYRSIQSYASADVRELERLVYQTGFYRMKARRIIDAAEYLIAVHKGRLPRTMEKMLRIPGVARKTANVVLGNAYGIAEGIAVDTHVKRLACALGLSDETAPEKIELDLMEIIPKKKWFRTTYLLIEFGRKYCPARRHDHDACLRLLHL